MCNEGPTRPTALAMVRFALIVGAITGSAAGAAGGAEMEVVFEHDGDPVFRVLAPGAIPAIDEPRFVRDQEADEQMAPEEPVLGLVLGDEARAYSLWQLDRHEIVNDRIAGTALAATW
jgi:hypothetical protein